MLGSIVELYGPLGEVSAAERWGKGDWRRSSLRRSSAAALSASGSSGYGAIPTSDIEEGTLPVAQVLQSLAG